jgi:hypothetical protein
MLRGVDYYRMSDDKQEKSIPEQEEWANQANARNEVVCVRAFRDEGVPGDEIALRVGLQKLVAFCEQEHERGRPIEVITTWDADRFSRANSFSTAAILDNVMAHGVKKMLTNEGFIDFEDDMQRVFFNLRQDLGKRAYSKSVSAAVSRTRLTRSRAGLWTGGPPPFGYILGPDGHLALGDPREVKTVALLFRLYLDLDVSGYALAEEFQKAGRPFPAYRGRVEWTEDLVRNILTNPQYTGDLYYNRNTVGSYCRTTAAKGVIPYRHGKTKAGNPKAVRNAPEDVIVAEGAHPAIVDKVTFAAVQRKMASRKMGGGLHVSEYPFSGLVRCGDCGEIMYGTTVVAHHKGKRYTWRKYGCARYMQSGGRKCHVNRIGEEDLLDKVAGVLEEKFADPGALADLREEMLGRRQERTGDAARGADRLKREMDRLAKKIAQGNRNLALARTTRDFERVSIAISEWEKERETLARDREEMLRQAHAQEQEEDGLDQALALLEKLGAVIRRAKAQKLRDVVKGLIEKVELRFEHRTTATGRTRSFCTGGDIHLRGDLGYSAMRSGGSPIW